MNPSKDFGSPVSRTKEFLIDLLFLLPRFPNIDPIAGVKIYA